MFLIKVLFARFFLIILFYHFVLVAKAKDHHLTKRTLLFPQYTVLQLTIGVSAPVILPSRTINLSLALQNNIDTPYNISNFFPSTLTRSAGSDGFDIDRHTLYRYIVYMLDGLELDGESCLFRAICELADVPVHIEEENSLLEKIVHYVLTPSVDFEHEKLITTDLLNSTYSFEEELLKAEVVGKMYGGCSRHYSECGLSLLDVISSQYKMF